MYNLSVSVLFSVVVAPKFFGLRIPLPSLKFLVAVIFVKWGIAVEIY